MEIKDLYKLYLQHPIVCTDTRNIIPGCLYFALRGDNFDGNLFASQALLNGAAFAIVDNTSIGENEHFVFTHNVLDTLQKLANYHRVALGIPIISITGTNGKTTTKELLTAVLSSQFSVCATKGNLNNHIGVPLTLLSLNTSHEYGIVEMGANHIGEIEMLCKIAEPNFGIITNIGKAHLEGFGSFEGVVTAKTEMYTYISNKSGVVFYNSDNELLNHELQRFSCTKISYGTKESDSCIGKILLKSALLNFSFSSRNQTEFLEVKTNLIGNYNFENALAACCVGLHMGINNLKIKEAIENYFPSNNRSQLVKVHSNVLLLDYYNANPSSIEVAIKNFAELNSEGKGKVILLGEMRELGDQSEFEHEKVVRQIELLGFSNVYLVGTKYLEVKRNKFEVFNSSDELNNYLLLNKIENSFVLIKGSRGVKMEAVLASLQNA